MEDYISSIYDSLITLLDGVRSISSNEIKEYKFYVDIMSHLNELERYIKYATDYCILIDYEIRKEQEDNIGNDIDKLFEKIKEVHREVENIKQSYGKDTSTYRI